MIKLLKIKINSNVLKWIFYLFIGIGISLAIYQYFYNKSIWLDEAMLAINIRDRSFIDLLKPLDYVQVAPIGFLYIEKLFTLIFGFNEFSLRLFPLFSFLISVPLFYFLADKLFKNKLLSLLSTAIFSTSLSLIIYSNEVKQYSSDVLFTIILLYLTLHLDFKRTKSILFYGLIGSIILWFSNIALIILATSGLYLLYTEVYIKKNFKLLFSFLLWSISFIIYYYLFIHNHPSATIMQEYWKNNFLPLDIRAKRFIFLSLRNIYAYLFGFGSLWYIPAIITVISVLFAIIYRQFTLIYFFITPVILHFGLSALHLYPFAGRLILYSVPLWILIFSYGAYYLVARLTKILPLLSIPLLIVSIYIAFLYLSPLKENLPFSREEIKEGIHYLEKNIQKNDTVYVYYGAYPSFSFYEKKHLPDNIVIHGGSHRGEANKYDIELKKLTGKVWLFFSHGYHNEIGYIKNYFIKNNAIIIDEKEFRGATIFYIDTQKIPNKNNNKTYK